MTICSRFIFARMLEQIGNSVRRFKRRYDSLCPRTIPGMPLELRHRWRNRTPLCRYRANSYARAHCGVIQTSGNGMSKLNLPVFVRQQPGFCPLQNPEFASLKTRRMFARSEFRGRRLPRQPFEPRHRSGRDRKARWHCCLLRHMPPKGPASVLPARGSAAWLLLRSPGEDPEPASDRDVVRRLYREDNGLTAHW